MSRKHRVMDKDQLLVFNALADYTDDEEWKNILRNMAKGVFIDNFNYMNGNLIFKRNGDPKKIKLSNNPEIAIKEIIKFMNDKNVKTKKEISDIREFNEGKLLREWSSVKSEPMKKFYINEFVDNYKDISNLSEIETDTLRTEVFIDFMERKLDEKIVEFTNGRIIRIKSYRLASNS